MICYRHFQDHDYVFSYVATENRQSRCEIYLFFSFRSFTTSEKYISFAQLVYFLREVCLLVMVDLGLFSDFHKGNCTWNLKAFVVLYRLWYFADPVSFSLNRFSFQKSEFANLVESWIFSHQIPINQKSLPGIEGNSMSSKDWEYLPIEFLNRFSFQMSEFANLDKLWIFSRQIPINQKSLPGNIFGWVQK